MAGRLDPKSYKRPSASGQSYTTPSTTSARERNAKSIADTNKAIKDLETQQKVLQSELKTIDEQIAYYTNITKTSTNSTAINNAFAQIEQYTKNRTTKKAKLKTVSADLNAAKTQLTILLYGIKPVGNYQLSTGSNLKNKITNPDTSNTDATAAPEAITAGPLLQWKYNPPMVKAAYLNPVGLQQQDGLMPVGNPGTWDDAMDAWRVSRGSKGVIQMSRSYPYYNQLVNSKAKPVTEDSVVHGFRFLYNPTTVSMSWGVGSEVDIAKFTAGSFRASPITDAAMNSSITFSVILNRMLDMNHVTKGGGIIGNPYPFPVESIDADGIYTRGTMLDLEYLFKAVNGKNVEYNSNLNGNTADLGWLNSFPVELHLGSGLRYLVRVTQINVDHKIFNERMVPIFSTVDFICKRLPDLPATEDYRDATNSGGGRVQGML
jgi:hypothetical protein